MNFSVEQNRAINTEGKNVLVFASAGAGKTTVLVERLMKRIIEDKISLDNILAMTFTEAAASNMKYRLEKRLLECDQNDPYIIEQLSLLQNAKISTIHSFCLSILKEYYFVLGIKKSRLENIINEADKEGLLIQSYKKVIENYPHLKELSNSLSSSIFNTDKLYETLNIIFNKACASYDPIEWLDTHKTNKINDFNDISDQIRNYYIEDIKNYLKLIKEKAQRLIDNGNQYQDFYNNVISCIDENNYSQLVSKIENDFKTLPRANTEEDKAIREEISKHLEKIASKLIVPNQIVNNCNNSAETINSLLELCKEYYLNYQKLKEEKNVIDFEDFEHYAYKLLVENNNEIANYLKNKYQEIMIDEFQDTNDTQYKIASLIANNNLFIVGDVKQSIYRFRNARPEIMNGLKSDSSFELIHIVENYRSQNKIVRFNNELYERMMNILSNDYPSEDIQQPTQKELTNPKLLLNNSEDFSMYDLIANKIMELHSKGYDFKDIAILVKSHAKKTPIRLALDKYNIPFFLIDKEGYLSSKTLDVLISYLKLLLDKNDKISKVSVLTSSIYKLQDNDLVKLKNNNFEYEPLDNDLENLSLLLKENRILNIVNYILNINSYYENLPNQEKANIDLFISNYKDEYNNLYDFINYVEFAKEYESSSASTISEDADVVRVMTMHNSKGLQFKIVFVLSESKNQLQEAKSSILVDNELGLGMNQIINEYKDAYPTIYSQAIQAKINKESLKEYLRLFYVATTRAIDDLYIVDDYNSFDNRKVDESLLYDRKGFTSYLFDLKYLDIVKVDKLIDFAPLVKVKNKISEIPSKKFNTEILNKVKPSDHQSEKLIYKEMVERGTILHQFFEDLDINNPIYNSDIISNDVVDNFVNSEIIKKCKQYDIYKELEFNINKNGEYIHGYMDFVAISADEIILIDYKTNVNVNRNDLIDLYTDQIETYKKVLRYKYVQNIKSYLYSTYLKEFIEI